MKGRDFNTSSSTDGGAVTASTEAESPARSAAAKSFPPGSDPRDVGHVDETSRVAAKSHAR